MEARIVTNINDMNICYELREIVFIKEQNVPMEEERDELDKTAVHFLLLEGDTPIGTGRVIRKGSIAKIGRFCILREYRKQGAGLFLMKEIINYCKKQIFKTISISAQEHALDFYKKLDFEICSEKYMDANIPHFDMTVNL